MKSVRYLMLAHAWLLLTAGVILVSVATLSSFSWSQLLFNFHDVSQISQNFTKPPLIAAADPNHDQLTTEEVSDDWGEVKGVSTELETGDARPELVANFLQRYDSPLKPYDHFGEVFVKIADVNHIDFRLLPAIAMQESNLCKTIPPESYNCLGFGIHERGTLTFPNFEANFARAAKELKKNYIDIGLVTPEQIMKKYTPSSNGSWAESVNQWMAEMRYDDRQLGRTQKTNADLLEFVSPTPSAKPSTELNTP